MSKLKEQYDALLAAGMPEHERVRWSSNIYYLGRGWDNALLDETHARDLLTMHALRWWVKCRDDMLLNCDGVKTGAFEEYDAFDPVSWGDDILDAIVQGVTK